MNEENSKLNVPSPSHSPTRKNSENYMSELKKQRGHLKGRLTQFKKYVDSFSGASLSNLQVAEMRLRLQSASEYFSKFNSIGSDIELYAKEEDIPSHFEYIESVESLYFSTMASAKCLIESCEITSLSGSALQVISALEFTASNYLHAWELLENRFHNHRLLIHNHIKALFNITCMKQESAVQIRKLIDTVLRNLRALKTLKEPTESWDTLIIYLAVSKLDSSTEREWENHKGSLDSNSQGLKLDQLLTFLRNRADMLEMISVNHSKPQAKPTSSNENKNAQQVHSYVSTNNDLQKAAHKGKSPYTKDNHLKLSCLKCSVLPLITPCLPSTSIPFEQLCIPDNIQLADPDFAVPAEIDLLIGADKFWELLNDNRIRLPNGPFLQNSKLGWLISGPINTKMIPSVVQCNFTEALDGQLRKFWEIENLPENNNMITRVFTQDER
ncbi:Gag-pol polyprotein, partial [Operophtera brumata]